MRELFRSGAPLILSLYLLLLYLHPMALSCLAPYFERILTKRARSSCTTPLPLGTTLRLMELLNLQLA